MNGTQGFVKAFRLEFTKKSLPLNKQWFILPITNFRIKAPTIAVLLSKKNNSCLEFYDHGKTDRIKILSYENLSVCDTK